MASTPTVTWFRNSHEHSLHYFKYGFMQLHNEGKCIFQEVQAQKADRFLPTDLAQVEHCRTVTLQVEIDGKTSTIVLDGEDSIFQLTPLIEHSDLYFVCSYNEAFFKGEPFGFAYDWQTECEVSRYRENYQALQDRFRSHLSKGRPLQPIGPSLDSARPERGYLGTKLHNFINKLRSRLSPFIDWKPEFQRFETRWKRLEALRHCEPKDDIVIKDSLWGWPRHRIAFHRSLSELSQDYKIKSFLGYRESYDWEHGSHQPPDPSDFPMVSGTRDIEAYEEELASSRLGAFTTGFHYGCRNIMTLAMFLGIRIISDPLRFKAIYSFEDFYTPCNLHGDTGALREQLVLAQTETVEDRVKRQQKFDQVALPHHGSTYILEEVERFLKQA